MNLQIPLALLSLTAAVFLGSQLAAAHQGAHIMRWQLSNADTQIENVRQAETQLGSLIEQRQELVKQATAIQDEYTALLNSVIELAKTDADARSVVQKWNIQRTEPPKPAAQPAADAAKAGAPAAGAATPAPAKPKAEGEEEEAPSGGVSGAAPEEP